MRPGAGGSPVFHPPLGPSAFSAGILRPFRAAIIVMLVPVVGTTGYNLFVPPGRDRHEPETIFGIRYRATHFF